MTICCIKAPKFVSGLLKIFKKNENSSEGEEKK